MRKINITFLLSLFSLLIVAQEDPVLFSVEDNLVRVSEFQYIYEKNNGDNADYSEESINDYLNLYIKFKLKVERAKEMGLDTIPALQKELDGYRKQLANSYLVDKEVATKLTEEVLERMKEDVRVSHIFIPAEPKSSKEKETNAREKANDLYRQLNAGQSFEKLARTNSEDKASALRGGDLGYYVAPLPGGFYEFENALYTTELGKHSAPIRSKMGYHILKITDRRPARGEMEVAHILIRKKMNGQLVTDAEEKINAVYDQVTNGQSFEEAVALSSDDKKSKQRGGILGFFGINQYEKTFEDAAFALAKDGDISKPLETQIGWHIIKRISKRDNSDEKEVLRRVKAKISKSDRFEIAQKALTDKIKKESKFKEDSQTLIKFTESLDEEFFTYKWQVPQLEDEFLMSFGNEDYSISDFANFAKKQTRLRLGYNRQLPVGAAIDELYEKFVEEAAVKYEELNLENKYPEFKALMREYEEGILLFEATKMEVWDMASEDTIGLSSFFEKNKENYIWKPRANIIQYTVHSDDTKLTKKIYSTAKKEELENVLDKYNKDAQLVTFAKYGYEVGSDELRDMKMEVGESSSLIYDKDKKQTSFKIIKQILPAQQKRMNEARGYIIADYQDFLEKEWIEDLKSRFSIVMYDEVLQSLIK